MALRILKYLAENPDAKDSLEGIGRWWLLRQRIEEELSCVQEALNLLEKRGLIIRKNASSTNMEFFQINKEVFEKIQDIISGAS